MKSKDQIAEEMDILKILKKLQEIDKLKRILLSDEQLYFFNLLRKPMIILDVQSKNSLKVNELLNDNQFEGK